MVLARRSRYASPSRWNALAPGRINAATDRNHINQSVRLGGINFRTARSWHRTSRSVAMVLVRPCEHLHQGGNRIGHRGQLGECPHYPKSGHWNSPALCPLCAISGHCSAHRRAAKVQCGRTEASETFQTRRPWSYHGRHVREFCAGGGTPLRSPRKPL